MAPNVLARLLAALPDGPTEESTARNGFLSHAPEWHALAYGLAIGLTGRPSLAFAFVSYVVGKGKRKHEFIPSAHLTDCVKEPAYSLGGTLLGLGAHKLLFGLTLNSLLAGW